jgi:hypothetical protein
MSDQDGAVLRAEDVHEQTVAVDGDVLEHAFTFA